MTTISQDDALVDALDRAMARMAAGEDANSILAAYPAQAGELAPLLAIACGLAPLRDAPELSPERLAAGRRRMLEAAARQRQSGISGVLARFRAAMPVSLSTGLRAHPLAAALAALILVAVSAGGGAVAASSDSLPDSPLYSVKLATEQVQILLAPDEHAQSDLKAQFEERRQHEQEQLDRRQAGATPPGKGLARTATVVLLKPAGATRTPEAGEVGDAGRKPSTTVTPTEATDDGDQDTPTATRTPRPTGTPERERTRTPESNPTRESTPRSTPGSTGTPRSTPYPTRTPEADRTPAPTRTPTPLGSATPGPSGTPTPQATPDKH